MSETEALDKPAPAPAAEKPAPPAEPPFTTDVLQSCTARFTRRGWDLYLKYKADLDTIRTVPVRSRLTARTPEGAQEIRRILETEGKVSEISLRGKDVEFTAPFATVQLVIRHAETHEYDAVQI